MRIVIDKYIPFIQETVAVAAASAATADTSSAAVSSSAALDAWRGVEVLPLEPEEITPAVVRNADALIVRTRTKVNAALLAESRVQFVATATIGYDHIDRDYCQSAGIEWLSCPGCNAQAVCDYVEEALNELKIPFNSAKIGIVGVGNVGTLVARMAEARGAEILLSDPPKNIGVSLDEIARNCDVVTFHTPLTHDGAYPTYHLCDAAFLSACKTGTLIINAARGGVVDENALLQSGHPCVIDTWEGEPQINRALLAQSCLASFHIAGYSVQGKYNASQRCLDALARHFALPSLLIDQKAVSLQQKSGDNRAGWLGRVSQLLKSHPADFEVLRKGYRLR